MPHSTNPAAIVRSARMSVCEAYYSGQHEAALAALAAASIRLTRHVIDGAIVAKIAYGALQEVAENLTLVRELGQSAVDIAIDTGPSFYDELAVAA